MSFTIVTDSCCDLKNEQIKKNNIKVLPLTFVFDDKVYSCYDEEKDIDTSHYYKLMRLRHRMLTSGVNNETAYPVFRELLEKGEDILFISFSKNLSVTYSVCSTELEFLKKKYPDRKIYAVDTKGGSLGQGILVLKACELKNAGKSIDEIYETLETLKMHIHHFFTVENLYWIYHGGRVRRTSYLISNILDIKPLLIADTNGFLAVCGKSIGRKKSLNALAKKVVENITDSELQTIYISHADCLSDANYLKNKISELVKVKDFHIGDIDLVMGSHGGPGTIGVFFLGVARV